MAQNSERQCASPRKFGKTDQKLNSTWQQADRKTLTKHSPKKEEEEEEIGRKVPSNAWEREGAGGALRIPNSEPQFSRDPKNSRREGGEKEWRLTQIRPRCVSERCNGTDLISLSLSLRRAPSASSGKTKKRVTGAWDWTRSKLTQLTLAALRCYDM